MARVLLLLLLLAAPPVPDGAADPVDAHVAAAEAAAKRGDTAEAAASLWRAAEIADRKQRDYARALALYDRLLAEYPAARLARGAEARRDYVRRAVAKGEEPFRRFETVRAELPRIGEEAARAEIEAIRRQFPDFPLADELAMWLADRAFEARRWDEARDRYRDLIEAHPESPLVGYAWAGIARAAFEERDYVEAERAFAKVAGTSLAGADFVAQFEVDRVRRHVARQRNARVAGAFLLAVLIAGAVTLEPRRLQDAARRALGRELLYLGPVVAVLVLVAPEDARRPMAIVVGSGLAWLVALLVWAEAARPAFARTPLRAASTLVATAGGAALLYVVLHALDLLVAVERVAGVS